MITVDSTPDRIALLSPWIRRFVMVISAWWLRTSSKLTGKKLKKQPKDLKIGNS